jgi:hypothetical protein
MDSGGQAMKIGKIPKKGEEVLLVGNMERLRWQVIKYERPHVVVVGRTMAPFLRDGKIVKRVRLHISRFVYFPAQADGYGGGWYFERTKREAKLWKRDLAKARGWPHVRGRSSNEPV